MSQNHDETSVTLQRSIVGQRHQPPHKKFIVIIAPGVPVEPGRKYFGVCRFENKLNSKPYRVAVMELGSPGIVIGTWILFEGISFSQGEINVNY